MSHQFHWLPTTSSSGRRREYRVRRVDFESYRQRQKLGLRVVRRTWSLTFNYPKAEIARIERFLDERSGWDTFLFTDPSTGSLIRVLSEEPEVRPANAANTREELSVVFVEETDTGASP